MIERLHYIAVTVLLILFDRPAALPPDALQRVGERSQETRIAVETAHRWRLSPVRVR